MPDSDRGGLGMHPADTIYAYPNRQPVDHHSQPWNYWTWPGESETPEGRQDEWLTGAAWKSIRQAVKRVP